MNVTHGSFDENDKEYSDSEYNMLDPVLLDLYIPVQDNMDSSIGPALFEISEDQEGKNFYSRGPWYTCLVNLVLICIASFRITIEGMFFNFCLKISKFTGNLTYMCLVYWCMHLSLNNLVHTIMYKTSDHSKNVLFCI